MSIVPALAALLACTDPPAEPQGPAAPPQQLAADAPPHRAATPAAPPPQGGPAMLPTPYTLDQMKSGWVPGVKVRFRMEVAGEPTTLHDWEVLSRPDEDHVETSVAVRSGDGGAALAPPTARVMSYEELRQHAAFPSSRATMEQALVQGPDGPVPGRRYRVRSDVDPTQTVTFEFADALPGPPVSMQTRSGAEVVQSMQMIARTGGRIPAPR